MERHALAALLAMAALAAACALPAGRDEPPPRASTPAGLRGAESPPEAARVPRYYRDEQGVLWDDRGNRVAKTP